MTAEHHTRMTAALEKALYEELEFRTGVRLSEGMTEQQLDEFEALVDRDQGRLSSWLLAHAPDFETEPLFRKMEQIMPEADPLELVAEYAATKWLELNRPNYRALVTEVQQQLFKDLLTWVGEQTIVPVPESMPDSSL